MKPDIVQKLLQAAFVLLFYPGIAVAQIDDGTSGGKIVMISREYARGRYFIYDCDDKHFACVDEVSMQNCQLDRKVALRERKYRLPCAPLRSFAEEKDCLGEHYKRMHNLSLKYFCLNQNNILILDSEEETKETVNGVIE